MVNNSININKADYNLLPQMTTTYGVENPDPGLGQAQHF
jgi:hypothetical protein